MDDLQRPMIKPDVAHRIGSTGIHISHHDDGFVVSNAKAAPVIARILGAIDGRRTAEQLSAALPEQARPLLTTLLEQLATHDMLTEGPAGIVDVAAVGTPAGRLARTFGAAWEHRLASWLAEPLRISGEDEFAARICGFAAEDGAPATVAPGTGEALAIASAFGRPSVVARAVGTRVAIGRVDTDELGAWAAQVDTAFGMEGEPPLHALRVAAALTAHEALLAAIDNKRAMPRRAKIVEIDGRTRSVDLDAAVHAEPSVTPTSALMTARANVPWLDPNGPLRRGEDVVPAFPLAHSRIIVCAARGHEAVTICEWSDSPRDADERALARACETLAARATGLPVWRLHASLLDAPAEAALAIAAAALATAPTAQFDVGKLGVDAGLLARIALLHWGELPTLTVASGEGAHLARVSIKGETAIGAAGSSETALAQAIGNALSLLQTGQRASGEERLLARIAAPGGAKPQPVEGNYPGGMQVAAS
jgi:hypothetical protein